MAVEQEAAPVPRRRAPAPEAAWRARRAAPVVRAAGASVRPAKARQFSRHRRSIAMKNFRETPGAGSSDPGPGKCCATARGASVGAAAESLAAESSVAERNQLKGAPRHRRDVLPRGRSVVLSDAQKEDFCDLMAADFGSCDEHPEDFPSRELAVEFVEDVKAKAKVSDGVAARASGGSTDLSGLFASVDELGPDLQTALAAAAAVPSEEVAEERPPRSRRRGV